MTVQDLIEEAYWKISIQNPSATQLTHALETLNGMLATWGLEPLLLPQISYSSLSDTVDLEPEVRRAVIYNLAVELAAEEGIEISPQLVAVAGSTLDKLKYNNIINQTPEEVDFDRAIVSRVTYNIYTDE